MNWLWKEAGATMSNLNIIKENPINFCRYLIDRKRNIKPDGIFYWSTIRLPFVRYALKEYACKMAVHVGNPVNNKFRYNLKAFLLHRILSKGIETKLFACSNYVHQSLTTSIYYKIFESSVSLNPVEIPVNNPYMIRKHTDSLQFKMGMVARFDPIKDHITVLKAFSFIKNFFPDAIFQLIGDGDLMPELKRLVNDYNLENSVMFLGYKTDVYSYLQSWDLFLYSTTPKEGLGNALSEALANGLPSIASDLPMLREIDGGSDSILFVPPVDHETMGMAAVELLNDFEKRKNMSNRAYNRAREAFSARRYTGDRLSFLLNQK